MRDWFFFIIWSIRLKKIIKSVYKTDTGSLVYLTDNYKQMFKQCLQYLNILNMFTRHENVEAIFTIL